MPYNFRESQQPLYDRIDKLNSNIEILNENLLKYLSYIEKNTICLIEISNYIHTNTELIKESLNKK